MKRDLLTAGEREYVDCLLEWYEEAAADCSLQYSVSADMVCKLCVAFERIAPKPKPLPLEEELFLAEGLYGGNPYSSLSAGERAQYERMAEAMRARGAK